MIKQTNDIINNIVDSKDHILKDITQYNTSDSIYLDSNTPQQITYTSADYRSLSTTEDNLEFPKRKRKSSIRKHKINHFETYPNKISHQREPGTPDHDINIDQDDILFSEPSCKSQRNKVSERLCISKVL